MQVEENNDEAVAMDGADVSCAIALGAEATIWSGRRAALPRARRRQRGRGDKRQRGAAGVPSGPSGLRGANNTKFENEFF
ncbi:MAG: hypothetical protein ACJ8DQ_10815, partial [Xanthobacteraceae bacterium]